MYETKYLIFSYFYNQLQVFKNLTKRVYYIINSLLIKIKEIYIFIVFLIRLAIIIYYDTFYLSYWNRHRYTRNAFSWQLYESMTLISVGKSFKYREGFRSREKYSYDLLLPSVGYSTWMSLLDDSDWKRFWLTLKRTYFWRMMYQYLKYLVLFYFFYRILKNVK